MKKIIVYVVLVVAALWFSFYTENLTERNRREQLAQLNPEELVETLMADSLDALASRAITLQELVAGMGDASFAQRHGHVLGIGSPTFYVVKGMCPQTTLADDELRATVDGLELVIPLKYIFGNTARDASGWFCIDNFQNTMDFNAVSAAMNDYITRQLQQHKPAADGPLSFLGAVAVKDGESPQHLTLIPYQIKGKVKSEE